FLFVEQYADRRDEATWTTAIQESITGLPVTVLLLTSDRAKGLIACAHNGMECRHLPELFHGQRDLCQPLMGPLQRQKETALKELEQVAEQAELGSKAQEALARGKCWLPELVAAIQWFWAVARICVEELDLPDEVERAMYERLLPGLYWQQAAKRARTAEERG